MNALIAFVGRVMIAVLFVVAGAGKFQDLAATDQYIQSVGLPAGLAMPAAIFEVAAGLGIGLGIFTRLFSILLAGFCLLTALMFHNQLTDQMQAAMFLKNVAVAGGLLILFTQTNYKWSYDTLRNRRRVDGDIHAAELRAARAEGRVEGVTHGVRTDV